MKINFDEKYEFNFPAWAVYAWEYGEDEGFDPYTPAEDIKAFRKFQRRMEREGFSDVAEFGDEKYFCPFPEFGDPDDCVKATFYKYEEEENERSE